MTSRDGISDFSDGRISATSAGIETEATWRWRSRAPVRPVL